MNPTLRASLLFSVAAVTPLTAAPFTFDDVRLAARQRAEKPFVEPENTLADFWKNLTYDEHRDIRFKMEEGLWAKEKLPFSIDLFHPGWTAKKTVAVEEIVDGVSKPVEFNQAMFDYGKTKVPEGTPAPPGYAGLAATAWWGFVSWQKNQRESQFLAALTATPGIVVTNTEHRHGQLIVQGLRDPLAPHPEAFVAAHFNSPSEVAFEMGTYLSAGTDYERMRQVEQERREAQSLKALWEKNEAQRQLLEGLAARQDAALQARLANALGGTIPQSVTMQWENDTLNVTGSLPASKLTQLKEEIVRLQPMVSIDATKVTSEAELPDPKRLLESLDVPFLIGTPQFEATSASMIQQIVERMQAIDAQSKTERQYRLRAWPITGERMEGNLAVQLNRLSLVKAQLQALGYPISRIAPGVAEAESLAGRRGVWVEVLPENSEAPPGE